MYMYLIVKKKLKTNSTMKNLLNRIVQTIQITVGSKFHGDRDDTGCRPRNMTVGE